MPAEKQPFPSVWTRPQRQRRDQPALSREQIVSTALQLLDTEGIDALSMRKLGDRLNAGATSMYSHVANKDELIELVVDEVYGEIEVPKPGDPADWRAATTHSAQSLRSAFLRHPWIVSVLGGVGVAYLGPNMMGLSENMLTVFEEAGFSLPEADQAVNTVTAYVIGMATSEAAWLTVIARSGQDEQEWTERLWTAVEQAVQPYPRLSRVYAAQRGQEADNVRVDSFEHGLECVLDGLESRLRRTGG
ncbi:TetR/AcrR family transcriptional regulator [Micromonospora sp. NPDC004704]